MIQEPGRRPYKRANRTKNRPVLVASTEQDATVSPEQEGTTSTTDSAVAVEAQPTISTTTTEKSTGSSRRLPGFFSTVGRKQQEEATTEADIAQARIARATRGKTPAKSASATESSAKEIPAVAKSEPKKAAARPAPRTGGFKTRYLFGMVLYLLAANFIGVILTNAFASGGIDRLLTSFNLFGGNIQIRTSTLAYLAFLVLLLVVLAYFDLIPRSFSAMSGQKQPVKRGTSSTKQTTSDNALVRNTPPPMRQGVKGADDDLYEEYRFNQRRSKKK
ncbi:MAG TPA: hypothetical protein VKU38_00105 [Ktedonobacteraceae bacterium]|nr:hypothetical protein [Ktedonobacteraceae bacterium]